MSNYIDKQISPQRFLTFDGNLCDKFNISVNEALFFNYICRAKAFKNIKIIDGFSFVELDMKYDIEQKNKYFKWNKRAFWNHVAALEMAGLIRRKRVGNSTFVSPVEKLLEELESINEEKIHSECNDTEAVIDDVKVNKSIGKFIIPSVEDLKKYASENGYKYFDADRFFDYYESIGWTIGKNKPMKDWASAVRNWIRNNSRFNPEAEAKKISNAAGAEDDQFEAFVRVLRKFIVSVEGMTWDDISDRCDEVHLFDNGSAEQRALSEYGGLKWAYQHSDGDDFKSDLYAAWESVK